MGLYPLCMGLGLVYSREHHVIDVIMGIVYDAGILAMWRLIQRGRRLEQLAKKPENFDVDSVVEKPAQIL